MGALASALRCGIPESELGQLSRMERRDWRTAIRIGVGYCPPQAVALAAYLRERSIDAEAVRLTGHVVTGATLDGTEWTLDPADAVVRPFGFATAPVGTRPRAAWPMAIPAALSAAYPVPALRARRRVASGTG